MRLFFFLQAEDDIRDIGVTGVQTCALPIGPPQLGTTSWLPVASWYSNSGNERRSAMKIEDTPVAKDEAEASEQAVNGLVRALEDLERHPDVAVYHGIGSETPGYFFEIDPYGWLFVVYEH